MQVILKTIFLLLFILIMAIGLALSTAHLWVHHAVAAVINQVTGFPVQIERSHVSFRGSEFGIYGISIKNPEGFPEGTFAKIPEIYVDFDFSEFLSDKKLHFQEVKVNLEEIDIIRNREGDMNVTNLKTVKKDQKAAATKALKKEKKPFLIDELVLTVRNIRYRDESLPMPVDRSVDLKIEQEVFRGVTNPSDIVRLIMAKVFYSAAFGRLGAPTELLSKNFDASIAKGEEVLNQSTEMARHMSTQILGEGRKIVEGATAKIPVSVSNAQVSAEVNQVTEQVKGKAAGIFQDAGRLLKNTTQTIQQTVDQTQNSNQKAS